MQDFTGSRSVSGGHSHVHLVPTLKLLHLCMRTAYRDPRMASDLIKRVQGKPEGRKLEVIVNDVMKQELPPVDVCISNTPYQVSKHMISGCEIQFLLN